MLQSSTQILDADNILWSGEKTITFIHNSLEDQGFPYQVNIYEIRDKLPLNCHVNERDALW